MASSIQLFFFKENKHCMPYSLHTASAFISLTLMGHQHDTNNPGQNRTNEKVGFKIDGDRYCSDAKGEPEWQV